MRYDVVVIGGNPAGGAAAVAAKKLHPEKSILVIRKEPNALIPCGIPYIFGTLPSIEADIKGIDPMKAAGIEFLIDEVIEVRTEEKEILTHGSKMIEYDRLIFATGSTPFVPPIEGKDLAHVVTAAKDLENVRKIYPILSSAKRVAVVGAGFIGVELSDELAKAGVEVTLIEAMGSILPLAFDEDMTAPAVEALRSHAVEIRTSTMVSRIVGEDGIATGVELKGGEVIPVDAVVLAIGYRPNTELARKTGLEIGIFGGIRTDEYLRTSVPDVFAAGDCVEHKDFFTRKPSRLMLASTAASEARIAGMNLFELRIIRQTKGSIAVFSTSLGDAALGAAGLTVEQAGRENFKFVIGRNKGFDRHPKGVGDAKPQILKLVFSTGSGVLLGAQVSGGKSTGEMINILGLAIQQGMTAADLATMQYGTQPGLTAGPGVYPIAMAAMDAVSQMCR